MLSAVPVLQCFKNIGGKRGVPFALIRGGSMIPQAGRFIWFMLAVLAAAQVLRPASASAQECPKPSEPVVDLDFRQPKPTLDATRSVAALRSMSHQALSEHDQALGLYRTELRSALKVDYQATTTKHDHVCLAVRRATVEIEYADRVIHLARELQRGTCPYEVTLAHEQKHASIDDRVLGRELPKMRSALTRAIRDVGMVGPIAQRNATAYRDDMFERIQRVFRDELERIERIRRGEQAAIDTPTAYRRESEHCPGGLAVR